jgi:DNA-binding NtrC family response regulator
VEATTQFKGPAQVLVIDDDEIMRDLVADWLEAAGYGVRKAADCPAGLAEVERAEPALVVTDMCMPGPGGGALIRHLKRAHPAIPIIAISGHFSLSGCSADGALALGAARALAKPVTRGEIMRAVAELVGPPGR